MMSSVQERECAVFGARDRVLGASRLAFLEVSASGWGSVVLLSSGEVSAKLLVYV